MKFYIRQTSGEALFSISDGQGAPYGTIAGDMSSLKCKAVLRDGHGVQLARIHRVGVGAFSNYTVYIEEREKAHVIQSLALPGRDFIIQKPAWSFRGDIASRSFDIIGVDRSVIMTHGCSWNSRGSCYAVEVKNDADALVCLCLAAIIDSAVLSQGTVAVPASP